MSTSFCTCSSIEWAHHAERAAVHDVRVDHCRPHVLVAEQRLDRANVGARFEEVSGEAVAESVASGALVDLSRARCIVYGLLYCRLVQVMEHRAARHRIDAGSRGRKEVLPGDRRRRARHLGAQGKREIDLAPAGGDLGTVSSRDFVELRSQALADAHRQERGAVVVSFAAPHHDLVALEVNVFDSQRQAFKQPEAAAIEHLRDEAEGRLERLQDGLDLASRKDRWKMHGPTSALQAFESMHLQAENAFVEEDDGAKGLILGRRRDATLHGEVVQEGGGFRSGQFSGVAAIVKSDEGADPLEVGFFGTRGVVQSADGIPDSLEEGHEGVSTRAAEMLRAVCRFFRRRRAEIERRRRGGRARCLGGEMAGRAEFGCVRARYIMEYARGLVPGNMEYARGRAAGIMEYAHRRATIAMLGGQRKRSDGALALTAGV